MTESNPNKLSSNRALVVKANNFSNSAAEKIPEIANRSIEVGLSIAKTKNGGRALTGAAAGAAIAAALPFVSVVAGAMLGAGGLVLWKSAKDRE